MWDVVFFSEMLKDLCRRSSLTPMHGFKPLPDPFNGFYTINQFQ